MFSCKKSMPYHSENTSRPIAPLKDTDRRICTSNFRVYLFRYHTTPSRRLGMPHLPNSHATISQRFGAKRIVRHTCGMPQLRGVCRRRASNRPLHLDPSWSRKWITVIAQPSYIYNLKKRKIWNFTRRCFTTRLFRKCGTEQPALFTGVILIHDWRDQFLFLRISSTNN